MFFWIWVTYSAVVLSAQKSVHSTIIASTNRHRHESMREVNVSSESDNFLGGQEFVEEIGAEESIEVFERIPMDQHFDTNEIEIPTYLKLMFGKLIEHEELTYDRDGSVLRALFPSKIAVGEFGSLVVNFEGLLGLRGFSTAHLILTQKEDSGGYTERSHPQIKVQYQNRENIISQRISKSTRFYKFNITEEIQATLNETGQMNFDMKCDIFKNLRRKVWTERVFVTTNPTEEIPFVLLTYGSFDVGKLLASDQTHPGRDRRALRTAPEYPVKSDGLESPIYEHAESPVQSICRKYEWRPTPAEVHLDDILFPSYLDLGYCSGKCPYPLLNDIFNYSTHSYLVDQHRLMRGFNVPNRFPVSSCVPARYKPLMVVQREEGAVVLIRSFRDASVESCGCR